MQAEKTLSELERAISEARKQCDEATAGECAAAWDTVEELSAAISHKKAQVRFRYLMLSCLHSMFWSFCCNLIDLTFHLAGTSGSNHIELGSTCKISFTPDHSWPKWVSLALQGRMMPLWRYFCVPLPARAFACWLAWSLESLIIVYISF